MLSGTTVVLMYHELAEDDVDIESWTVVRKSDFVRQVEYLRAHFEVVSLEDALAGHASTQARPRPRVAITFDDGDRGNARVLLPIVNEYKLPVAVFIATRQIVEQESYWFDRIVNALQTPDPVCVDLRSQGMGRYFVNRTRGSTNWTVIQRLLTDMKRLPAAARERAVGQVLASLGEHALRTDCRIAPLDEGGLKSLSESPFVTIGAHSHCHNILTQLDSAAVAESVSTSKRLLERWTGREVWSFAYPNGACDDRTIDIVRRSGFRCALATDDRLWTQRDPQFAIPRMGVGRYDSLANFKLSLVGGARHVLSVAGRLQ
jgi:peptidoglycan/xylan/chitin deacetylase (PgdA/CDA1 family)